MAKVIKVRMGEKQAKRFLDNDTLDWNVKAQLRQQLRKAYPETDAMLSEKALAQKFVDRAMKTGEYEAIIKLQQEASEKVGEANRKLNLFYGDLNAELKKMGFAPHYCLNSCGMVIKVV